MLAGQRSGGRKDVPKSRTPEGDEMVQDPVCKVYVPASRAVVRRVGGSEVHFCSEECAGKYAREIK